MQHNNSNNSKQLQQQQQQCKYKILNLGVEDKDWTWLVNQQPVLNSLEKHQQQAVASVWAAG